MYFQCYNVIVTVGNLDLPINGTRSYEIVDGRSAEGSGIVDRPLHLAHLQTHLAFSPHAHDARPGALSRMWCGWVHLSAEPPQYMRGGSKEGYRIYELCPCC